VLLHQWPFLPTGRKVPSVSTTKEENVQEKIKNRGDTGKKNGQQLGQSQPNVPHPVLDFAMSSECLPAMKERMNCIKSAFQG
jgi:hypothetical protein